MTGTVRRILWVRTSIAVTLPLLPPATRTLPSGLKATPTTPQHSMGVDSHVATDPSPGVRVPEGHRAVADGRPATTFPLGL